MKIIGNTGYCNQDFIVEISKDELANLLGRYSSYQMEKTKPPKPGDTVNIHEMYMRLREMSGMKSKLENAKAVLQVIANGLQLVEPVVTRAVEIVGEVE